MPLAVGHERSDRTFQGNVSRVTFKSMALRTLRSLLVVFVAIAVLLLLFQHQLIYHPRKYRPIYREKLPINTVELKYQTSQGKQQCFYVPQRDSTLKVPARVWVMFPGNASLALDWLEFLAEAPDRSDAFLLIDYPGYGECEGSASPEAIQESVNKAVVELAGTLNTSHKELDERLNVIGLSIGCATALQFAAQHPIRHVVLIAPFTTLREESRRIVGFPLCYLLLHNYDNRTRLAELASRQSPPTVTIFHGSADSTIPPAMGRELAALFPKMIGFHEVPGADHNSILAAALAKIDWSMKPLPPRLPLVKDSF